GARADQVCRREAGALDAAGELVRAILAHAADHPGMPRLLFHDIAGEGEASFRDALGQLVEQNRAVLGRLIREAVDAGEAPATLDAAASARLLLALVQGTLLQWELGGRSLDLGREAERLLALWRAGLAAGAPAAAPEAPAPRAAGEPIVALDV